MYQLTMDKVKEVSGGSVEGDALGCIGGVGATGLMLAAGPVGWLAWGAVAFSGLGAIGSCVNMVDGMFPASTSLTPNVEASWVPPTESTVDPDSVCPYVDGCDFGGGSSLLQPEEYDLET